MIWVKIIWSLFQLTLGCLLLTWVSSLYQVPLILHWIGVFVLAWLVVPDIYKDSSP
jgi:hypothetical protein